MFRAQLSGLWAQIDGLDDFVSALRDKKGRMNSGDLFAGLLLLAALLVAVWILARILDRISRKQSYSSPSRLLWSLSRAHRLRWSQWWLLRRIAQHQKLQDPALLFVDHERLDPARLGPAFACQRLQIQALRARLFSDLAEMQQVPTSADPP